MKYDFSKIRLTNIVKNGNFEKVNQPDIITEKAEIRNVVSADITPLYNLIDSAETMGFVVKVKRNKIILKMSKQAEGERK